MKKKNLVLRFNPNTAAPMLVACLWDHWQMKNAPELYSFAAITDDPPPEIAATGHQRCIIKSACPRDCVSAGSGRAGAPKQIPRQLSTLGVLSGREVRSSSPQE